MKKQIPEARGTCKFCGGLVAFSRCWPHGTGGGIICALGLLLAFLPITFWSWVTGIVVAACGFLRIFAEKKVWICTECGVELT